MFNTGDSFDEFLENAVNKASEVGKKKRKQLMQRSKSRNETERYKSDNRLSGTKYQSDSRLAGTRYSADKNFQGTKYRSDKGLEGQKYGADKGLEGRKYGADKGLEGRKYGADRRFEGEKYGWDTQKNISGDRIQSKERRLGTELDSQEKRKQWGILGRIIMDDPASNGLLTLDGKGGGFTQGEKMRQILQIFKGGGGVNQIKEKFGDPTGGGADKQTQLDGQGNSSRQADWDSMLSQTVKGLQDGTMDDKTADAVIRLYGQQAQGNDKLGTESPSSGGNSAIEQFLDSGGVTGAGIKALGGVAQKALGEEARTGLEDWLYGRYQQQLKPALNYTKKKTKEAIDKASKDDPFIIPRPNY